MADPFAKLNEAIAILLELRGDAPPEPGPTAPPPSRFVDGKSPPDNLGRVELELVERLVKEFGEAPNGFRIPRLWMVEGVDLSHLAPRIAAGVKMNIGAANSVFNQGRCFHAEDWFLGTFRLDKKSPILGTIAWKGDLATREKVLRERIEVLLKEPPYTPQTPADSALESVAGFLSLPSFSVQST